MDWDEPTARTPLTVTAACEEHPAPHLRAPRQGLLSHSHCKTSPPPGAHLHNDSDPFT